MNCEYVDIQYITVYIAFIYIPYITFHNLILSEIEEKCILCINSFCTLSFRSSLGILRPFYSHVASNKPAELCACVVPRREFLTVEEA